MLLGSQWILIAVLAAASGEEPATDAPSWFELRAGAGFTFPTGGAARRRDGGPSAQVSLTSRPMLLGWRVDVSWDLLRGQPFVPSQEWDSSKGDISTLGLSAALLLRPWSGVISPYLAAGAGIYWMQQLGGYPSPYGDTYGVHATFGFDLGTGTRFRPFVEAQGLFHITDYGSEEYQPTVYGVLRAGVQFSL